MNVWGTLSNEFKCSTIINIVNDIIRVVKWIIYTPLARIIHVYSFIFLSNISTIITFSSAWTIYKQLWRSCGIFGSNQSFIIIFYPPSVSRSSSTSLIFHSTRRPFPSTFVEYSPVKLLRLFVEITREIVHRLNKNYVRRWSRVTRRR